MVLIIAITAFLLVTVFFVLDTAKDQSTTSELSSFLSPFESETFVRHNYAAPVESVWKEVSNLAGYNYWFPGVARLLPVVETDRYVHKYSFDKFDFTPGSELTIRPRGPFPAGKGIIASAVPNKKLEMVMQFNPLNKEFVRFDLSSHSEGTTLTCTRKSYGPFSFLTVWGFDSKKSKILDNLGFLIPEQELVESALKDSKTAVKDDSDSLFQDKNLMAAYLVNKALDGDDNIIKATQDVYSRGKAKAMLIKINAGKMDRPPMPDPGMQDSTTAAPLAANAPPASQQQSPEDILATVVNQALDGDDGPLNALDNKVIRAKAKALIVKINKGTAERPALPSSEPQQATTNAPPASQQQSPEDILATVVNQALDGDDGPLNALDNKVIRAKAKALIVKINKGTAERPALPSSEPLKKDADQSEESKNTNETENKDKMIERLVADGVQGKMDEINNLTDKVLRGKIKAAIVKAKRSS